MFAAQSALELLYPCTCGATGISGWSQKRQGKDAMPYWVLVHIQDINVCVWVGAYHYKNAKPAWVQQSARAPNRPAGLVWQHVQYEHQDDTSSLGYI